MKKIFIISTLLLSTVSGYCTTPLTGSGVASERHHITVGEALTGLTGSTSDLHITSGQVQGVILLADVSVPGIEKGIEVNVSIYPNPTSQLLNVKHNLESAVTFNLVSTSGATMKKVTLEEPNTTLDLQNLPQGIYILTLTSGHETIYTSKVIKR